MMGMEKILLIIIAGMALLAMGLYVAYASMKNTELMGD